jgi:hypothetical protein
VTNLACRSCCSVYADYVVSPTVRLGLTQSLLTPSNRLWHNTTREERKAPGTSTAMEVVPLDVHNYTWHSLLAVGTNSHAIHVSGFARVGNADMCCNCFQPAPSSCSTFHPLPPGQCQPCTCMVFFSPLVFSRNVTKATLQHW